MQRPTEDQYTEWQQRTTPPLREKEQRLNNAAPALLEALQDLVGNCEDRDEHGEGSDYERVLIKAARKAMDGLQ